MSKNPIKDHIDVCIKKYNDAGWATIRSPPSTSHDFIANKDAKYHYVLVKYRENENDVKFEREPLNIFVQNSMSNSSLPVVATLKYVKSKKTGGLEPAMTCMDVNSSRRVIVAAGKKQTKSPNIT